MLFFPSYDRMWKNDVQQGRPQMTIWGMSMAFWVTKARDTGLLYVILIAFPLQQSFYKLASGLHDMFTTSGVLDFLYFRFNSIIILKQISFIPGMTNFF